MVFASSIIQTQNFKRRNAKNFRHFSQEIIALPAGADFANAFFFFFLVGFSLPRQTRALFLGPFHLGLIFLPESIARLVRSSSNIHSPIAGNVTTDLISQACTFTL